jgi:hypothetical protein
MPVKAFAKITFSRGHPPQVDVTMSWLPCSRGSASATDFLLARRRHRLIVEGGPRPADNIVFKAALKFFEVLE